MISKPDKEYFKNNFRIWKCSITRSVLILSIFKNNLKFRRKERRKLEREGACKFVSLEGRNEGGREGNITHKDLYLKMLFEILSKNSIVPPEKVKPEIAKKMCT